jgi:hypothetical protein
MQMFKKLQENSLYWRYRFITRRWLAMRRWWRERRSPHATITSVRYRGMSSYNPYVRSSMDRRRGIAFVVVLAAALTALQTVASSSLAGLAYGVVFVLVVVAITYAFARFW